MEDDNISIDTESNIGTISGIACNFKSCKRCNPKWQKLTQEELTTLRQNRKRKKQTAFDPLTAPRKFCYKKCHYCLKKLEHIDMMIADAAVTREIIKPPRIETKTPEQSISEEEDNNNTPFISPEEERDQLFNKAHAPADGNCLYYSILMALDIPASLHMELRTMLAGKTVSLNLPEEHLPETFTSWSEYSRYISQNYKYGNATELALIAKLVNCNILLYEKRNDEVHKFYGAEVSESAPTITLERIHGIDPHYNPLIPKTKRPDYIALQTKLRNLLNLQPMESQNNFNCLIWNCRSMASQVKKNLLASLLISRQIDIAFLQEHFLPSSHSLYFNGYYTYKSSEDSEKHRKGTAILVSKRIQAKIKVDLNDPAGRYIKLRLHHNTTSRSLSSIYLENATALSHFVLPDELFYSDIVAGDCNNHDTGLDINNVYHTKDIQIEETLNIGNLKISDHPVLFGTLQLPFTKQEIPQVQIQSKEIINDNQKALANCSNLKTPEVGFRSPNILITPKLYNPTLLQTDYLLEWNSLVEMQKQELQARKEENKASLDALLNSNNLSPEEWSKLNRIMCYKPKNSLYTPDNSFKEIVSGFKTLFGEGQYTIDKNGLYLKIKAIAEEAYTHPRCFFYKPKSKACDVMGFSQRHIHSLLDPNAQLDNLWALIERTNQLMGVDNLFNFIHLKTRVLLIRKTKNASSWTDMRPISIIPAWLIVLEKISFNYIKEMTKDWISNYQFGFKEGIGCTTAKFALAHHTQKTDSKYLLLIDIKKAYDSVNRDKLQEILYKKTNKKDNILSNFIEIYCNLSLSMYGEEFIPIRGLPQGSVLSPLLFNIYIDSVLRNFNDEPNGLYLQAYADDMIMAAKDIKTLEKGSNHLLQELLNLGLHIHPTKCNLITDESEAEITLGKTQIISQSTAKYLGQPIDYKGLDNTLITKQTFTNLEAILSQHYYISKRAKVKLFQTYVRSKINHILPLLSVTKQVKPLWKKLRSIIFNKVLDRATFGRETSIMFKLSFYDIIFKPLLKIRENFNTPEETEFLTTCLIHCVDTWIESEPNLPEEIKETLITFQMGDADLSINQFEREINSTAVNRLLRNSGIEPTTTSFSHIKMPELVYLLSNAPMHILEEKLKSLITQKTLDKRTQTGQSIVTILNKYNIALLYSTSFETIDSLASNDEEDCLTTYTIKETKIRLNTRKLEKRSEECSISTLKHLEENFLNQNQTDKMLPFRELQTKFRNTILEQSKKKNEDIEIAIHLMRKQNNYKATKRARKKPDRN